MADDPVSLKAPLPCWHESLASARTDLLVALSVDGAFIATPRPLTPGTPVFIELALGEVSEGKAEIDAVAVAGGALGGAGFAVRFLSLDEKTRAWIEARVRAERPATPVAEEPVAEEPVAEEPVAEEPVAERRVAEERVAADVPGDIDVDTTFTNLPRTKSGEEEAPAPAPQPSRVEPVREETQRFMRAPGPAEVRLRTSPLMPGLDDIAPPPPSAMPDPDTTQPFAVAPPRVKTQVMGATPESTPPPEAEEPPPLPVRPLPVRPLPVSSAAASIDETQPWVRVPGPVAVRTSTPLSTPVLPLSTAPSLPMPRITSLAASLDIAQPPTLAIEETQRWPTARVRVTAAPLELPVADVAFSPPDVDDDAPPPADGGLDALFSEAIAPAPIEKLEVPPALSFEPSFEQSFQPSFEQSFQPSFEPSYTPDDDAAPLPVAADARESLFGSAGGMLGDDDAVSFGGSGSVDFGAEVTDPGGRALTTEDLPLSPQRQELIATAEDDFVDNAEPLEMVEIDPLNEYQDVIGAPVPAFDPFAEPKPSLPRTASSVKNPFAPSTSPDQLVPAAATPSPDLPSTVNPFAPAQPDPFASADSWDAFATVVSPTAQSSWSETTMPSANPFSSLSPAAHSSPPTASNPFAALNAETPTPQPPANPFASPSSSSPPISARMPTPFPAPNPFAPSSAPLTNPFAMPPEAPASVETSAPSPPPPPPAPLADPFASLSSPRPPLPNPFASLPPPPRPLTSPTAPFHTLTPVDAGAFESPVALRPAPQPTTRNETEPYLSVKGLSELSALTPPPALVESLPLSALTPLAPLAPVTPVPSLSVDEPPFASEALASEPMPQSSLFTSTMEPLPPPPQRSTDPFFPTWQPEAASAAASMLGNDAQATVPPTAPPEGETFFDELAFGAIEPGPSPSADADHWRLQVSDSQRADEDDLPLVVGNDLPVVAGAPLLDDPLAWVVGEPAKK